MKQFIIMLIASICATLPNMLFAQSYTQTTGEMGSRESPYASVRGWNVLVGTTGGQFEYCVAVNPNGGYPWRLGNSIHGQWQLSVGIQSGSDWEGTLEVDGDSRSASGSATKSWAVVWLGLNELERVKKGDQLIVGVGKHDFDASLTGTTAAVLKVEECLQYKGRKPRKRLVQRKSKPRISYNQPKQRTNNVAPRDANGRVVENDAYRMGAGCPKVGAVISPYSNSQTSVEFIDQTSHQNGAMTIYWLDGQGRPVESGIFEHGRLRLNTYVGHSFVVKDRDGNCYGGVYTMRSRNNEFTVR